MNPFIIEVPKDNYNVEVWVENVAGGIDLGIGYLDEQEDYQYACITLSLDDAERIANALVQTIEDKRVERKASL